MTDDTTSVIKKALENLRARRPKPRGRRQEFAPFADQLRELLAAGWTRTEIVAEVKALGGKMSPALLRDVLQIAPAKPKTASRTKTAKPSASLSPSPAAPRPGATAPSNQDQPVAGAE
jgi:hypothetical protein